MKKVFLILTLLGSFAFADSVHREDYRELIKCDKVNTCWQPDRGQSFKKWCLQQDLHSSFWIYYLTKVENNYKCACPCVTEYYPNN